MFKSFRFRLYPTECQKILINKHIGSVRFLYNLALETKQMTWAGNKINLTRYDLCSQLKELKSELVWLKDVNSQSLQGALMNLDAAYLRFFKGLSNFPKYKKKTNGGSFNIPQRVSIKNGKLIIPKFQGGIELILHRPIEGTIRRAVIRKTPTGKYFVSILCEPDVKCNTKPKITEETTIGIDLGIKNFITTSNGKAFENPKFLKQSLLRLKYIHRKYSKYKGKRTKLRGVLLNEKITNQRKNFLHKVSSELIKNHDSIAIENLSVSNMIKNHCLARVISDAGWSMFVNMLEYKAEWYGVNILKIGRFEPSSKICSACGSINKTLQLKDREWTCKSCGALHDRDINAACNIKSFALKNHLSAEHRFKNQNELPTLVGVLTSETLISL